MCGHPRRIAKELRVPDRILPDRPNLDQYRKQAKELLRAAKSGEPVACTRMYNHHPRFGDRRPDAGRDVGLADAQLVLAREHGYESWAAFAQHIEKLRIIRSVESLTDPLNTFVEVACVDRHGGHDGGTLEHAEMILSRSPEVATGCIYSAAVLGDKAAVRSWLARDASLATAPGGPHMWDALTYLCFSRYLRIDKTRSEAFVATARLLLEAGANANSGWIESIDTPPRPIHESVIYGAAGVAQNADLTRLLLEYGADPNDEETPYHVAETHDNAALGVLLRSGRFNQVSLATVGVRKCDWHDEKGLELALEHGADPNYLTRWHISILHQAIRRDNGMEMIEALLDRKADPTLPNRNDGRNAIQMAAYHGRGDVLASIERRGFAPGLEGLDAMVAACARADFETVRNLGKQNPQLLSQLLVLGGTLLARFAGADNDAGVRCLLALGVPASATWPEGDSYWELSRNSTALHVAAWRAHHEVVRTLLAAGTPVNAVDARNRTPLQLAVKACTNSYWKYRRRPDSVVALLAAGATTERIELPTGYDAIDDLLGGGRGATLKADGNPPHVAE
jgi:ankyrin repeat protein